MSPAAQNLVIANNLDPGKIKPTGPKGLLLKEDVLSYIESKPAETTQKNIEKP